ncbi:MAG: beta-ketoacyl-ACP synthase II [Deltaproteobacteria bacterium]|nr:beta-ketoacyl-ACP synthase II [Deltaproteobacteria bacterium]
MEKVVVTGLGAVSCLGNTADEFWDGLIHGRSGISAINMFDSSLYSTRIAGEVKGFVFQGRNPKRLERFSQFAVTAAAEALAQAGLLEGQGEDVRLAGSINPFRVGVSVGSGIGGFPFLEKEHAKFLSRGAGKFHPLTVPIIISNMAAANTAIQFGLQGPNFSLTTACATGNNSLAAALDCLRLGRAEVMVAGGVESTLSPFALNGYIQLKALSTRNEDPAGASRPFSRDRDGFVLAEGGGVLVLETLTHAKRRGAVILAELAGVGLSADAYHLTAPDPEAGGAAEAIRGALRDAGLDKESVDYINAHGTSTPLNDATETLAIKQVFGGGAKSLMVSSIKSMVGHCLGGASGLEAVCSVKTLVEGLIPPTINLHDPDPALDLDYVPNQVREARPRVVLSNAFGFGGHNAVAVFSRFE